MKSIKYSPKKAKKDVNDTMERASMVNNAFTHIFDEPTAREDYERTEIQAMKDRDQPL